MSVSLLAAKTKEIDPTGEGLSPSYVGFIVGGGKSVRETCSDRAAQLIAAALDREIADFFEDAIFRLDESTSTRRTEPGEGPTALPERLMDQAELSRFLRKSMSWIDAQIQEARARGELWPGLIYVGRSRRFDPAAVLEGQRLQRSA
ncbi:hypothetical protein [Streptomyces odonnellii]|uniref:hypothetical protein n=1 Tax=Streptomyces odonnellii TaxID=1417980 RepID=UPI0012FF04F7|nr:hypothetical protein [Streptomyces odonnellii]